MRCWADDAWLVRRYLAYRGKRRWRREQRDRQRSEEACQSDRRSENLAFRDRRVAEDDERGERPRTCKQRSYQGRDRNIVRIACLVLGRPVPSAASGGSIESAIRTAIRPPARRCAGVEASASDRKSACSPVRELIARVAQLPTNVLLTGVSGNRTPECARWRAASTSPKPAPTITTWCGSSSRCTRGRISKLSCSGPVKSPFPRPGLPGHCRRCAEGRRPGLCPRKVRTVRRCCVRIFVLISTRTRRRPCN